MIFAPRPKLFIQFTINIKKKQKKFLTIVFTML